MNLFWKRFFRTELFLFLSWFGLFFLLLIFFRIAAEVRLHRSMQMIKEHHIEMDFRAFLPPPSAWEEPENGSKIIEDAIFAILDTQDNLLSENDQYAARAQEILDKAGPFGIVPDEDIEMLRDAVRPYAAGVEILSASRHCTFAFFETDYTKPNPEDIVLPDFKQREQLSTILCAEAWVAMKDGEIDRAYELVNTLFRYGIWCFQETPSLMSNLYGYRISLQGFRILHYLMQSAAPSPEMREQILEQCHLLRDSDHLAAALNYEIIYIYQTFAFNISLHTPLSTNWMKSDFKDKASCMIGVITDPYFVANNSALLDFSLPFLEMTKKKAFERISWDELYNGIPPWAFFVRLGAKNYKNVFSRHDIHTAFCDLIEQSLALQEYRETHETYPNHLDEIQSRFPNGLPKDTFSGENYSYKITNDDFSIYSVGPDFESDGGTMSGDILDTSFSGDYVWAVSSQPANSNNGK